MKHRERERERERQKETHTHTETRTHTHEETHTHTHGDTKRETQRERERERHGETKKRANAESLLEEIGVVTQLTGTVTGQRSQTCCKSTRLRGPYSKDIRNYQKAVRSGHSSFAGKSWPSSRPGITNSSDEMLEAFVSTVPG